MQQRQNPNAALQQIIERIKSTEIQAEAVDAYNRGLLIAPSNISLHKTMIDKASKMRSMAMVKRAYEIAIGTVDIDPKIHYYALLAAYENNDINFAKKVYSNAINTNLCNDDLIHQLAIAMGIITREKVLFLKKQYLDQLKVQAQVNARPATLFNSTSIETKPIETKVSQHHTIPPIIAFIYRTNDLTINKLYEFGVDEELTYFGHIIKYSLEQLTASLPNIAVEHLQEIYLKICSLITSKNINQLLTSDCGTSMYCIAKILTSNYFNLQNFEDKNLSLVLNHLLTKLLEEPEKATSKDLVGALWAVAKLIQHGKFPDANKALLPELLGAITQNMSKQTNPHELADMLWAIGIINTKIGFKTKPPILCEWAASALRETSSFSRKEKNKIVLGISLLELELDKNSKSRLKQFVDECSPKSMKWYQIQQIISPYFKKEGLDLNDFDFTPEENVCGFYVDLVARHKENGNIIIFEFDGKHHYISNEQIKFDEFRDSILKKKGFHIERIDIRNFPFLSENATSSYSHFSSSTPRSEPETSDTRKTAAAKHKKIP